MKKVLIAVDYNPVSERVVTEGYALAKELGAKVCLMHVVADPSYYEISYPEFMGYAPITPVINHPNFLNDIRKNGENFLKSAAAHLKDANVETHLAEGNTVETILEYSIIWGASILVLGTHSHSTLEKLFLGSVAASIIEKTTIPAYLIPVKR